MNRIEISVLDPQAALDTFAKTWRNAGAGRSPTPTLACGSLHELFEAITERRLALMRQVAAMDRANVSRLTKSTDQDPAIVQDNVERMRDLGLLVHDDRGELRAPYDEIVIHAEIRKAA
jgi:predicted transcriptional regulator